MKYAAIQNGVVTQLLDELVDVEFPVTNDDGDTIAPDEVRSVHISDRFHPDFVAALVLVPEGQVVAPGDSYDGESFGPPPIPPAPTTAEVLAQRDALLAVAALRIAPLQDAVDLDVETGDEVAMLTEWKQYRVDLNRLELQVGFPDAIEWPVAPT